MALRVAQQAGLDESATRGVLGETMAALVDDGELPATTPPRRASSITLSGRLSRVYGYGCLVGPALFTGAVEQAGAMLDMAIAACRDPEPGSAGEALEQIGAALSAAAALLESDAGTRPAINLLYHAIVRAATEIPDSVSSVGAVTQVPDSISSARAATEVSDTG
jgi:hypothetical protein